jgi:predicted nuclease with TOPRIM domain
MMARSYEDVCEEMLQLREERFQLSGEIDKLKAELDDARERNAILLSENGALLRSLVMFHEENARLKDSN